MSKINFQPIMLALLIILSNSTCRENSHSTHYDSSSISPVPLLPLLSSNEAAGREQIARAIEIEFAPLFGRNDLGQGQKNMRVMLESTIQALRLGSNNVCNEDEKITVFHGRKDSKFVTTGGKEFLVSGYVAAAANKGSFQSALDFFASYMNWAGTFISPKYQLGINIDPNNYDELASRHTLSGANSPFLSTSISAKSAGQWGDKVFQLRMCPGRVLSTSNQKFLNEKEFLIFGFVLPEEVVQVGDLAEALKFDSSILKSCYNYSYSRKIVETALNKFNQIIVKYLEDKRGNLAHKPWSEVTKDFVAKNCDCQEIMRQTNTLFLQDAKEIDYIEEHNLILRPKSVADACMMDAKDVRPLLYVLSKDTIIKTSPVQSAELSNDKKCKLNRGDSIEVDSFNVVSNHLQIFFHEVLPNNCSISSPAYIFNGHAKVFK